MRTVAWPSHASVIALSFQVEGAGRWGAFWTSRPNSSKRPRMNRAPHIWDVPTQAPAAASAPVARKILRLTVVTISRRKRSRSVEKRQLAS